MTTSPNTETTNGHTVVVSNPASGGATEDDALRAAFSSFDVHWSPTTEDDPGIGQSAAAVRDGAATVVACGGDGTVRAVLESLTGSDTSLGIVPLGTGNLLAANLGLAEGLDAVPDAVSGTIRRLDVGRVNGERFAVMAGIGFDALLIRDASSTVKRRFGSVAYVISAIRNLPAGLFGATVEVDGKDAWRGRTAMVLVGNCGTVTGGLQVFPDATPDDGQLDVAILSARKVREWASVLVRLVRGQPQRPDLVFRAAGATVKVSTSKAIPYELDGEDRPAASTLSFDVEPSALSVRVPLLNPDQTSQKESS